MTAYKEGKQIEFKLRNVLEDEWENVTLPLWNWHTFDYRIKPEQEYRPYINRAEFIEAQNKHGMYLYFKDMNVYKLVTGINPNSVAILWDSEQVEEISYKDLLKSAVWSDKTPCGIEK